MNLKIPIFIYSFFFGGILLGQQLSPEELQEDFDQFKQKVTKLNPGLDHFISLDELEAYWDKLESYLNEPLSITAFAKVMRKAIKPIGERHMSIGYHKKSSYAQEAKAGKRKFLPLVIYYVPEEEETYILRNVSSDTGIQHKSKLISINGHNHLAIRDTIFNYINTDNAVDSWRVFEYNNSFNRFYNQFIDSTSTFQVKYIDTLGVTKESKIKGLPSKELSDTLRKLNLEIYNLEKNLPALYSRDYDSLKTSYLRIKTFNKKKIRKDDINFKKEVRDFFDNVENKQYENIIIDLRNNTGGRITYLLNLLAHIQDNAKKQVILKRTFYPTFSKKKKTKESKTLKQREPKFNGQVYVINNGGSYSASITFISFARELANVITVGEVSGGRYNGTTAGSFKVVRLKNSDLTVRIPMILMDYLVKEQEDGGVIPDYSVNTNIDDFFSLKSDAPLHYVLDLIAADNGLEN